MLSLRRQIRRANIEACGLCPHCKERPLSYRSNAATCGAPACKAANRNRALRERLASDPIYKEKHKAAMRAWRAEQMRNPVYKKKRLTEMQARYADPVYREKHKARMRKKYREDRAYRERLKARMRAKAAELSKDPAYREKRNAAARAMPPPTTAEIKLSFVLGSALSITSLNPEMPACTKLSLGAGLFFVFLFESSLLGFSMGLLF